MNKNMKIKIILAAAVIVLSALFVCFAMTLSSSADDNIFGGELTKTISITPAVERMMQTSNHYVVIKAKQMGASHYAYTEAVYDSTAIDGSEYVFNPGSQMVALSVLDNGDGTASIYEKVLVNLSGGVVRDPSVSADGTRVIYSKKIRGTDDFHIYEMELTSGSYNETQLTFGSGRADIEPQYLPDGSIIFSSTRDTQTIDCWYTPVSNLFIMNGDGTCIRRVGYDQVHTTFPTTTSDGRVLYTRWDYNDRTQMFVQGVFQMFPDGSYQTEVWGNDADFPTTLLHTREIPGAPGKYISIASGHHVMQKGKLVIVDTTAGRNSEDAIKFLFPDSTTVIKYNTDTFGQSGRSYKYPYAIDEQTFLVSAADNYSGVNTPFNIYLCDRSQGFENAVAICEGTTRLPASQIVPIKTSSSFDRVSLVDYAQSTGTYYVSNVYAGASMQGVEAGRVKYLRVVSLEYRSSAIGATTASGGSAGGTADVYSPISVGNGSWDVKNVLGIVPVEADGSALFEVPSDTPVYFQLLDEDGCMIQTMRSWSTLMPGETFSCVGCHENKNTAPAAAGGVTLAMKKGVQRLQKDLWMGICGDYDDFDPYSKNYIGFSYPDVIQPILNESCIVCHSDLSSAFSIIQAQNGGSEEAGIALEYLIPEKSVWDYSVDGGAVRSSYAPFGVSASNFTANTKWSSGTLTLTKDFVFTQYAKDVCVNELTLTFSGSVTVKVNGTTLYTDSSSSIVTKTVTLTKAQTDAFTLGHNTVELTVSGGTHFIDCAYRAYVDRGEIVPIVNGDSWKYLMSSTSSAPSTWKDVSFDDSSWSTGVAPFGDRGDVTPMNTSWAGSNTYIWLRKSFEVTSEQLAAISDGSASMRIFYDDSINIYVNGVEIFNDGGWNNSYETKSISKKPSEFLVAGTNVIAISLHNTGGGRAIDLALKIYPKNPPSGGTTTAKFSLSGGAYYLESNRPARSYPLSYLVLTDAYPSGSNWKGSASGRYAKWISTMSGAERLEPDYSGSGKSPLIARLKNGHGGLTSEQIKAIECWIDLAVPCYGSYSDGEMFSSHQMRIYTEKQNKRTFYDLWDQYSKMELGGVLPEGTVEATYTSADGKTVITESGNGYAILYAPKYGAGDVLTVRVTGSSYVGVSFNERQSESILYLPDGTFTFTVPAASAASNLYNPTFFGSSGTAIYINNTILVRIPTQAELSGKRNLALNAYDLSDQTGAFPHVSSNNEYDQTGCYAARNAIDGSIYNKAHGGYPNQSWGTRSSVAATDYLLLDFGRTVSLDEIALYLRADGFDSEGVSHDAFFSQIVLEFSNGTSVTINPRKSSEKQTFAFEPVQTTYVKLTGFVSDKSNSSGWTAITELQAFGYEVQ